MFYLGRLFLFVMMMLIAVCGSANAQRCPTPNPNITAGVAGHPFFDGCPLSAGALNRLPVLSGSPPIAGDFAAYVGVPGVSLAIGDSGVSVAGTTAARASTNAALKALSTASMISGQSGVYREGFSTPGDGGEANYIYSSSPCTLNSGNGDNGSQVKGSDGGCFNITKTSVIDPLVFGARCDGASDDTPALNAVDAYLQTIGGGTIKYSCTLRVAGTWVMSGNETLSPSGPMEYNGMSYIPGPTLWPPPHNAPAINCVGTGGGVPMCIKPIGFGNTIENVNIGSPQTPPPDTGTWSPIAFPPAIGTVSSISWGGLKVLHSTCTGCSTFVDLEGTPDYTTFSGSDVILDDLLCNPCSGSSGFILRRLDFGPYYFDRLSNIPRWYSLQASLGAYLRAHSALIQIKYAAAVQFGSINCYATKLCLDVENDTVTNSFGTLTFAASALQINQFYANNVCQAIATTGNAVNFEIKSISQMYVWGDETGFQCSKGKAMIDLPSNLVKVAIDHLAITDVDTFASIGCGTPGTASCPSGAPNAAAVFHLTDAYSLPGFTGYGYGGYTTGAPFIKAPAPSFISISLSDTRLIIGSGGPFVAAGLDGTTASMQYTVNGFFQPNGKTALSFGTLPTAPLSGTKQGTICFDSTGFMWAGPTTGCN